MNIVLCENAENKKFNAGNKARTDVVNILIHHGYRHIALFKNGTAKITVLFHMIGAVLNSMIICKRGEEIIIQYPYYPQFVNMVLIKILTLGRKIKGYRITVLIHDAISLRTEHIDVRIVRKEVALFDNADKVICHNAKMKEAFEKTQDDKYVILGIFDYICNEQNIKKNITNDNKIIIAGNLSREKCGYLYKLDLKNIKFNLYGIGYEKLPKDNIEYKGSYEPDRLVNIMEGSYGLVWDGDSINTCNGICGQYLKYNNPHKLSLYIAAGLPVIVWSKSALAGFVKDNGIGICIDSLYELEDKIKNISEDEYSKMLLNVQIIRQVIIHGGHLISAIG